MLSAALQFAVCAAVIAISGIWLVRYADILAEKTKLGGTWIGVILVATVTSLPELATGLSSVTVADTPDIAIGDVMGSCVFNLLLIALLDFLHREEPIYLKASQGHILSAGFSVMLIGLVVFGLLSGDLNGVQLGHVGLYTPVIIVLYVVAMRAIFVQERRQSVLLESPGRYGSVTLREAVTGYSVAGAIVVLAGTAMPFAADRLATVTGWSQSFVGTLFVAAATSLPEAVSTVAALRIGATDLAIGNLFGSNLFNILVVAIDDIAYVKGPLLADVSLTHATSGASAIIMTGAAVVGLYYRPRMRLFRVAGWVSLALVVTYVLNTLVLYLRGH